jgi:two-component system response regulator NreC
MDNVLKILLAEDHQTVREGIKLLVQAQPDMKVIGEAANGDEALALAKELDPDVVLMDISMPVTNGLQAAKKFRAAMPDIRILMLTRHTDDGYLRQLISAGANGYVLKQSAPAELVRALRTVGNGDSYIDPTLTKRVMGGYAAKSESLRGENKGELSEREKEVLRLIAFGYSNKEIASRTDISVKTVEAHKANAMRKLGATSRIDIVKYAILQQWLHDD